MNEIFFKSLENGEGLYQIKKATKGSAGFDLLAAIKNEISIDPGSTKLIPCGFSIQMPDGIEGQVRPRSGIALKNSVTVLNSPGTIDSDYRGEIAVILINHGNEPFKIEKGSRIAQIVICPVVKAQLVEVDDLNITERGDGGFGSTGTK